MPGSSLSRHLESGVDPGNEVVFERIAWLKVGSRSDWLSKRGCLSRVVDASRKHKF